MFLKLLLLTLALVAIAVIGMAIRILLVPKGKFPDTHIGNNKKMREMGIKCARHNDIGRVSINHTGEREGRDLKN
jgi:membrane protein insertase Oxa1/YidC/SpoIIIJ